MFNGHRHFISSLLTLICRIHLGITSYYLLEKVLLLTVHKKGYHSKTRRTTSRTSRILLLSISQEAMHCAWSDQRMTCKVGAMSHDKFWLIKCKSWTTASGKHFLLKYVLCGILQNTPQKHCPHVYLHSSWEIPVFNLSRWMVMTKLFNLKFIHSLLKCTSRSGQEKVERVNTHAKTTLWKQLEICELPSLHGQ